MLSIRNYSTVFLFFVFFGGLNKQVLNFRKKVTDLFFFFFILFYKNIYVYIFCFFFYNFSLEKFMKDVRLLREVCVWGLFMECTC